MILKPICPKCGGPMTVTVQLNKSNGYARKRFRCKRSRCHYATTSKAKVLAKT